MQRIIARQTLEIDAMKAVFSKNDFGPRSVKEAVRALQTEGLSQRQACALVSCPRKTAQYRLRKPPEDPQLREQLKAIAEGGRDSGIAA